MEKLWRRYAVAYCGTVVATLLLWALAGTSAHPLWRFFLPQGAGGFELSKLCFWPYAVAAALLRSLGDNDARGGGHCAAALCAALLLALLATLLPLANRQQAGLAWLLSLLMGLLLHGLVFRRRLPGSPTLWYALTVLIAVGYVLLSLLLTAPPPFLHVPTVAIPV